MHLTSNGDFALTDRWVTHLNSENDTGELLISPINTIQNGPRTIGHRIKGREKSIILKLCKALVRPQL